MIKPHPIDIYAGKKLRTLRLAAGKMSQEVLAEKIGVTFQQIQKYETGVNRMGSSRLHEFATIFGVSVLVFFPESERVGVLWCTMKHVYSHLPIHHQELILDMVRALLQSEVEK